MGDYKHFGNIKFRNGLIRKPSSGNVQSGRVAQFTSSSKMELWKKGTLKKRFDRYNQKLTKSHHELVPSYWTDVERKNLK